MRHYLITGLGALDVRVPLFFINTSLSLNNPMSLAGYWRLICPAFLFKSTLLDWLIKWLSLDRPSNVVIRRTNRWNRPSSTCSYGKLLDFDDCVFLSCCCLVFICLTARSFFGRRRWRPWQQSAFDHQSNSWSKIQRYGRRVFTLSLGAGVRKNCCRLDKTREMGEGGTSRDSHGTGRSVSDRVESYWTESGKIDQPAQRTVSRCSENQNTRASQAAAQPRRWWQVSCCAPTERRISWATWLAWKRNTVRPGILQHYWDGPRHPSLSFSLSVCPSVRV